MTTFEQYGTRRYHDDADRKGAQQVSRTIPDQWKKRQALADKKAARRNQPRYIEILGEQQNAIVQNKSSL